MIYVQAGDKYAGPENHLAKIIQAAHQTKQSRIDKASRIFLLRAVLLQIRGALEKKSDNGDHKARDAERDRKSVV